MQPRRDLLGVALVANRLHLVRPWHSLGSPWHNRRRQQFLRDLQNCRVWAHRRAHKPHVYRVFFTIASDTGVLASSQSRLSVAARMGRY